MDTSHPSHSKTKRPAARNDAQGSSPEAYWISLAAGERAGPLGALKGGVTVPNGKGRAIAACWRELGREYPALEPDLFVLRPRHVEGILLISPKGLRAPGLSEAVRRFKALSARRLEAEGLPAGGLWKKGYAERQISGKAELAEARKALKSPRPKPQ